MAAMEIELKYIVPDRDTFQRLLDLAELGAYRLREAGEQRLTDHYFDTPGRAVLHGGYAVRLREDAAPGRWVGTLKGLGGAAGARHEREEFELDVPPGAAPEAWPASPARDRALQLSGQQPLAEILAIQQQRHKRLVMAGEREVAELSLDAVTFGQNSHEQLTYELEIELRPDGTRADLRALEAALRDYGLRPQPKSKFERGLALVDGVAAEGGATEGGSAPDGAAEGGAVGAGTPADKVRGVTWMAGETQTAAGTEPEPPDETGSTTADEGETTPRAETETAAQVEIICAPQAEIESMPQAEAEAAPAAEAAEPSQPKSPGVRADEPMAEAGRKVLRFHFDRMVAQEAGARQGDDIEAVHDMRVATRRQRAAVALFAGYFKRKPIRRFKDALKVVGGHLGTVRDLDVQLDAARTYQASLSATAAAGLQPVVDAWDRERDAARAALLAHLDSRDYRSFKKAFGKFVETEAAGVPAASDEPPRASLVRQVLPGQLWEHYGEVRAYEDVIPGADVTTLHALRITAKRLRYALEFFREVLEPASGGSIGDCIDAIVALQDHLGELHDADVTLTRLHEFLQRDDENPLAPEAVIAVGAYLKVKQAELQHLQQEVGRTWRKVNGEKYRRVLGKAAAAL
jgi:CHAD domain-containing protein